MEFKPEGFIISIQIDQITLFVSDYLWHGSDNIFKCGQVVMFVICIGRKAVRGHFCAYENQSV